MVTAPPPSPGPSRFSLLSQSLPALLWVVSLAVLANLNVLNNGVALDDESIIQNLTAPSTWRDLLLPSPAAPYYRPLISLSYLLDYKIWGRNPFGFHLSVLIGHAINTALVFLLSRRLFLARGAGDFTQPTLNRLSLVIASLFAVHPVHAEAVAWIPGRSDVFCATFMLSSLFLYLYSRQTQKGWAFAVSMAAFLLALLTKEIAVGLVLLFPLFEFMASSPPAFSPTQTTPLTPLPLWQRKSVRLLIPVMLLALYFTGLYLWMRIERIESHYNAASLPIFLSHVSGSKLPDLIGAAGLYLKLMVFPYPHQPFIDSLPTSPVFLVSTVLAWLVIIGGIIRSIVRRHLILGMSLVWMSVLLAPPVLVAVIGGPTTPAAERYVYAPSIGFLIATVFLVYGGLTALDKSGRLRGGGRVTAGLIFIGVLVLGGWENWNRNTVWKNPVTFWKTAVAGLPDSGFSHRELGLRYAQLKQYADAERQYLRAIELYEKGPKPNPLALGDCLNDLAAFYYMQNKLTEAEPLFYRSLAIREKILGPDHPDVAQTLNNLVALYFSQGRYAEAEPLSRRSVAIREKILGPAHPDLATSLNNLAGLLIILGKYSEADSLFKRVLSIREKVLRPDHPDLAGTLQNYAVLLRKMKRAAEAQQMENRAKRIREANGPSGGKP